jgi:hypothetical protein
VNLDGNMKIIVYIRSTEDWANYTYEKLTEYTERTKSLSTPALVINIDDVLMKVKHWDNSFSQTYFKYRESIKKIAISSWSPYTICYNFEELLKIVNDEDIVCPSDDDDWFRHDLAEKLPMHLSDVDLLVWDQVVHMTNHFGPHNWFLFHDNVSTNNYCIRGVKLKKMNIMDQMAILNNENAFLNICCKKYKFNVKYIMDDLLSCYVWHIGSLSNMSLKTINEYKQIWKTPMQNPDFMWTMDLYKQLLKIHNALSKSNRVLL